MRKIFIMLTALPLCVFSQDKMQFGIIGGANFANVTGTSSINRSNSSGFMAGVFIDPPSKGILSKRIEFLFSRQGYDYSTNTNTGSVELNYVMMPTMMCIKLGKFAAIQGGLQTAILLNAKADTTNQSGNGQMGGMMNMMSQMNRFNIGIGTGLQIYPFKGIIIGARYNIALNQTYKEFDPNNPAPPSMIPDVDVKHNLVQLFLGYKF